MPATTNKLKYIKATDKKYADLGEEIKDLHTQELKQKSKIEAVENKLTNVDKTVAEAVSSISNLNHDIEKEVIDARGSKISLNERLGNMELFKATQVLERLTVDRIYEYNSEGDIVKEKVRGQLSYDIEYSYLDGNASKESYYDIAGKLIGSKEYEYDTNGNIVGSRSVNGEVIAVITNSYITNDLECRLAKIEAIDFIKAASVLNGETATVILTSIQDLVARVANLEYMLPGNITNIADIPYIMDKLKELEYQTNLTFELHEFNVNSTISEYYLPDEVTDQAIVHIDGLMLQKDDDYVITKGKIKLLIPLIDGFTVTCKYKGW